MPDYAFVPGIGDNALDVLRQILELRPHTAVAHDPTAVRLDSWLGALDFAINTGLPPADSLLLGCHGDSEGELFISFDSSNPSPARYETLEKVNASGSILVSGDVMNPGGSFRLLGCLIGSDECLPFLRLLKQALGQAVKTLTASRFVHSFKVAEDGTGVFEFMKYEHRIMTKEPLSTRDKVVGTFGNADLRNDLDNSVVPLENWEAWIPAKNVLNLAPATSHNITFDVPSKISPKTGGFAEISKGLGSWWVFADSVHFTAHFDGTIPADEAGQIALIPLVLANAPSFADAHPFPVYKRYHFKTRQEFIDGLKWKPTVQPDNSVSFVGRRYRYEVLVPVFTPGTTNDLIFNYYPVSGTPVINFTESNQPFRLFGVV
jgi:hypothetical protein